jgi:hypothetical protein
MTVIEKSNTKTHRSLSLVNNPPAPRPVIRSGCSMSNLELARKNATPFAEDFYWQHFSPNVLDLLMANPNISDSVRPGLPRNPCANDINSPNCVYVG